MICLALFGCAKDPISTSASNNSGISVDKLFKHDGCTVYRFSDSGHNHYFTKCEKADSRTESMQSCGQNCTKVEEIEVKQ